MYDFTNEFNRSLIEICSGTKLDNQIFSNMYQYVYENSNSTSSDSLRELYNTLVKLIDDCIEKKIIEVIRQQESAEIVHSLVN